MKGQLKVSASILCADFTRLADEIKKCEDAGVDSFHIDVMDGHFVPNLSIGPVIIEAVRPLTKLPLETHLMIANPSAYIDQYISAGSDTLMIQVECYGPLRLSSRGPDQFPKEVDSIDPDLIRKDIQRIKDKGKKAYVVINPGTPLCIDPIQSDIDGVLIMSVNPGFAKQKFMPLAVPKIQELQKKFKGDIAIDGGINDQTAIEAVKAGARHLITASFLFRSQDLRQSVGALKSLLK